MPDTLIIGAGISGLTAAHHLAHAGKDVLVLESQDRAGGKIVTDRVDGYLLEAGPNSLRVENQATLDLIDQIGLMDRILDANPTSKKRFILKNGAWVKVPSGPPEAITSSLFSLGGKLRILAEPFISKTKADDETASSFVTRRLGKEVMKYGADPFITGIYAGDPTKLSMRYALSAMWSAEQEYGSLILGMLKRKRSPAPGRVKPRVISFPNGLSEVVIALREKLGDKLHLHSGALTIEKSNKGYTVHASGNAYETREIILSLPAYHIAEMVSYLTPDLSTTLRSIDYPPVAVVYLGYRIDQFDTPPEGFGGLIPSHENRNILGVIFSSSNFPGRAPEDHVLLTTLIGGARNKAVGDKSKEDIISMARSEIADLLKPKGSPTFEHVTLWKRAIPQYNVGYGEILRGLVKAETDNPGLHFLGNYRGGISMGSCIRNATELAKRLV